MRKALIILTVGLAVLLFPTPALANTHSSTEGKHLHFKPSAAPPGSKVWIRVRMWDGATAKCKGVTENVKVAAAGITGEDDVLETTNGDGFFWDWWTMGSAGSPMVYVRCLPTGVLYKKQFSIKTGAALPDTGTPALLTLGVGLTLITAGWLMLVAARSERLRPAVVIPPGAKGRLVGRARGSGTGATLRR